jgi:hypothetical protein
MTNPVIQSGQSIIERKAGIAAQAEDVRDAMSGKQPNHRLRSVRPIVCPT